MTIPADERYLRHLQLAEIGPAGQARLGAARALVAGAGGLGCAALPYLVAAGLRGIVVCDGDRVESSNLPRQVLYGDDDIGRAKAAVAAARLTALNREVSVTAQAAPLDAANVDALVAGADVVLDCLDDFAARYLLHDACHRARRPLVSAAVHHDAGQLAVFRFDREPARPCWRCLWPQPPAGEVCAGTCRTDGILGTVPGLLGVWQADQALRVLLEASPLAPGQLVHVDVASPRTWRTRWTAASDCPLCGRVPDSAATRAAETTAAVGMAAAPTDPVLPEQTDWTAIAAPADCLWIDARSADARSAIPDPDALAGCEIVSWRECAANGPPRGRVCVVFCDHGLRSLDLVRQWRRQGLTHVTSLRGGLAGRGSAAQRSRRT